MSLQVHYSHLGREDRVLLIKGLWAPIYTHPQHLGESSILIVLLIGLKIGSSGGKMHAYLLRIWQTEALAVPFTDVILDVKP